jgi:hypothetical protein
LLVRGGCSGWRGKPTGKALDFPAWQGAIPSLATGKAFPVGSNRVGIGCCIKRATQSDYNLYTTR